MLRVALALACAAACSHPGTPPVAPELTNRVPVVASRGDGDPLDYIPIDSDLVFGIDAQKVVKGALWQRFIAPAADRAFPKRNEVQETCGFDPLTKVTKVVLSAIAVGKPDASIAVVIQGLERVATIECMSKIASRDTTHAFTQDGDAFYGHLSDGKRYAITFAADHTMLAIMSTAADKAALARRVAKEQALTGSRAFLDVLAEIEPHHTAWMIANGKSLTNQLPGMAARVIFGTIDAEDGLAVDLRVRFPDPAAAAQLTSMASAAGGQVRTFVDRFDVATENSDTRITAEMSATKIAALAGVFGKQSIFAPTP